MNFGILCLCDFGQHIAISANHFLMFQTQKLLLRYMCITLPVSKTYIPVFSCRKKGNWGKFIIEFFKWAISRNLLKQPISSLWNDFIQQKEQKKDASDL